MTTFSDAAAFVSTASNEDLNDLIDNIKARRKTLAADAMSDFSVGDRVKWASSKRKHAGKTFTGIVTGFNKRSVAVAQLDSNGQAGPTAPRWRIGATLLQKVS